MSLQDFTVLQKIGSGSFGEVFKAKHNSLGLLVALKVLPLPKSRKGLDSILNEIRILASFKECPHIITYRDSFFSQHKLFIVTDWAQGGDLESVINNRKRKAQPFSESQILQIVSDITRGLMVLHSSKVLHRDLKPANVLLSNGRCKIADLNISKLAKHGLVMTQTGTPYYSAPQVWRDEPYSISCDIWSLGCIIYHLAHLRPPFEGKNFQELNKKVQKANFQRLKCADRISSLIEQTIRVKANQRASVQDILGLIEMREVCRPMSKKLLETIRSQGRLKDICKRLPKNNYKTNESKSKILQPSFLVENKANILNSVDQFIVNSKLLSRDKSALSEYFGTPVKTRESERELRTSPKMQSRLMSVQKSKSASRKLSEISRDRQTARSKIDIVKRKLFEQF